MEETNKTTKEMLEEKIRSCLDGLEYVEQGEEQHARLTADIQHLVAAWVELEKVEQTKFDSDRRFKEEIRQKDLDRDYKDILERDRMHMESERRKEELKCEKRSGWRDAGIKVAGMLIQTVPYALLLALGMRLEFIDCGAVTGFTVKELFRVLHSKPVA